MLKVKSMIPDWKEILKNCSIEKKKMILSSIIKEIIVYDNKIDVHLRISFKEFLETAKKLDISKIKGMDSKVFENMSNTRTSFFITYLGTLW